MARQEKSYQPEHAIALELSMFTRVNIWVSIEWKTFIDYQLFKVRLTFISLKYLLTKLQQYILTISKSLTIIEYFKHKNLTCRLTGEVGTSKII